MEATIVCYRSPCCSVGPQFRPNMEKLKRRLLRYGVDPSPKILHALRKKELQKFRRRLKKQSPSVEETNSQSLSDEGDLQFRDAVAEYRTLMSKDTEGVAMKLSGKPWNTGRVDLRRLTELRKEDVGGRLKDEHLVELKGILNARNRDLGWLLEDDLEQEENSQSEITSQRNWLRVGRQGGDRERIQWLVKRLSISDLQKRDWKFSRLMIGSRLAFSEVNMLRIVEELGRHGQWRQALSVVEWVYSDKEYKHYKSRYVYTKLLAVLGKARKPVESLTIFRTMQEGYHIYPDMAAYRCIAVTLGQAGLVKDLLRVIDCMKQRPSKLLQVVRRRDWNPCLEPDVVVYNSVLNACVPHKQWKGVFWVLEKLKQSGLKPSSATYGLAMEVMLRAGKYDLVHKFFEKMKRRGVAPNSHTYKVLVSAFWEEGKINDAVGVVLDMERRGIVGTASVYYELACCLCNKGRWRDAMIQIEKLRKVSSSRPLEIAFTGMIKSCMDGGHLQDCISMFEHIKGFASPDIGLINIMLKVYGRSDMFSEAKKLFESIKMLNTGYSVSLEERSAVFPDSYSYWSMLEASSAAQQWEYFEYVYKQMTLCGIKLDQRKHIAFVVEASRAGKWHLLEHWFEMLLEAGEIPCQSLFVEMICQTVAQLDFERLLSLVNSMDHVPYQIREKQWLNVFRRYSDRTGKDELRKLLGFLGGFKTPTTTSCTDLLKALQSICSEANHVHLPSNIRPDHRSLASSTECAHDSVDSSSTSTNCGSDDSFSDKVMSTDDESGQTHMEGCPIKSIGNRVEDISDLDVPSEIISSYLESDFDESAISDEDVCDERVGPRKMNSSCTSDTLVLSKTPSAPEILRSWKEARARGSILHM